MGEHLKLKLEITHIYSWFVAVLMLPLLLPSALLHEEWGAWPASAAWVWGATRRISGYVRYVLRSHLTYFLHPICWQVLSRAFITEFVSYLAINFVCSFSRSKASYIMCVFHSFTSVFIALIQLYSNFLSMSYILERKCAGIHLKTHQSTWPKQHPYLLNTVCHPIDNINCNSLSYFMILWSNSTVITISKCVQLFEIVSKPLTKSHTNDGLKFSTCRLWLEEAFPALPRLQHNKTNGH